MTASFLITIELDADALEREATHAGAGDSPFGTLFFPVDFGPTSKAVGLGAKLGAGGRKSRAQDRSLCRDVDER
jgi:hypothetical protein